MIIVNVRLLMMTSLGDVLHTVGRLNLVGVLFCLFVVICTCFNGFTRPHTE
jgi:hypothetical protein